MTWIQTIDYSKASGKLLELYDRVKGPGDNVDNIMQAHSLRPHSMEGHMALYKNVLHHFRNTVPRWFLETLGIYVSLLNRCDYCVQHHFAGLQRLIADDERASAIRTALESESLTASSLLARRELAALEYARKLTTAPHVIEAGDIDSMRVAGWNDGEILEINQVVAYFAYANRTVLGLGVDVRGDILGLSPSAAEDPADWRHQ